MNTISMFKSKGFIYIKTNKIYQFLFLLLMFIYGFFSSPTPDKIGIPEIIILFLLIAIISPVVHKIISFLIKQRFFLPKIILYIIFIYLLIFESFYGLIIVRNNLSDYIRDFIPFLYFLLPIFLYSHIKHNPKEWLKIFLLGFLISGIGFIYQFYNDPKINISNVISITLMFGSNRDNPWQEPTTIFTLSFLGTNLIYYLFKKNIIKSLIFFSFFIPTLLIYIVTATRAPIALTLFMMFITLTVIFPNIYKNKTLVRFYIVFALMFIIGLIYYLFYDYIYDIFYLLLHKTEQVGILNSRNLEILAVIDNIKDIPTLLFGEGWGGLISNPIGYGSKWRFVHNMFFYYVFKTGILGLIAVLLYLYYCLKSFKYIEYILTNQPIFFSLGFLSLIPPFFVASFLEPMFKTLTYGVMLSIFVAFYLYIRSGKYARIKQIQGS